MDEELDQLYREVICISEDRHEPHRARKKTAGQSASNPEAGRRFGASARCRHKGYDAKEFIEALQEMNVQPYVTQNKSWRQSAVPDRIARSEGYVISQQK